MNRLLVDSGPLIASYAPDDRWHDRCVQLFASWPGKILIPEPVLGETCSFLRNSVRRGAEYEAVLLQHVVSEKSEVEIVNPTPATRNRAAELVQKLVSAPFGYVDSTVLALAEELRIPDKRRSISRWLGWPVR